MTKKNIINIVLIVMGIAIIVFFGMRVLHAFKRFDGHHPPPHGKVETDVELIRDWMTVPFIAHMYHVPDKIIFDALEISPQENRDKSLKDINQEKYPGKDGLVINVVKALILANQPPAPPDDSHVSTATVAP